MTKEQFIGHHSFWDSYKPLLWEALQNTDGNVVELGMGTGSTQILHEYCLYSGRNLFSYDNNLEWYRKFEYLRTSQHAIEYNQDWLEPLERHRNKVGVLFSDEAPGLIRKYNISMFANTATIIIAHDTELSNDHGYKFSLVEPLFKYKKRYEFNGADASAFSNFINVGLWSI